MLPEIDTEVDPSPKKLAPTPSETTQTTRIAELCHQSYICKNVYQRNFGMLQKVGTHFSTIVSLNVDKVLEDYWNYRVSRLLNLEIVGITDQALWCHNPCLFLKVTWDSFRVLGRRHSSALSRVSPAVPPVPLVMVIIAPLRYASEHLSSSSAGCGGPLPPRCLPGIRGGVVGS